MTETGSLNHDFRTCLYRLMTFGTESHPRGTTTKELLNYNITLHNPRNRIINFKARKTNLKYLLGEFIWYLSGGNNPDTILPYSKFWDNIRNSGSQGDLYPKGTINSNYGHRLFGHANNLPAFVQFDQGGSDAGAINQWADTKKLLTRDRDTRQAIINIHVPADRHEGNKDVPCTLTLQFFIRENQLQLIVNMRSNDIILGFTNDVFQFTLLQELMLMELRAVYPDLQLGTYFHNAGSMHIYDRHFEMAQAIIAEENAYELPMVTMTEEDAKDDVIHALQMIELEWRLAGMGTTFEFDKSLQWNRLTPYWQNLIKMCFAEDHEAMHAVFGIPDHE